MLILFTEWIYASLIFVLGGGGITLLNIVCKGYPGIAVPLKRGLVILLKILLYFFLDVIPLEDWGYFVYGWELVGGRFFVGCVYGLCLFYSYMVRVFIWRNEALDTGREVVSFKVHHFKAAYWFYLTYASPF